MRTKFYDYMRRAHVQYIAIKRFREHLNTVYPGIMGYGHRMKVILEVRDIGRQSDEK